MISDKSIDEVKEAADLVEVIKGCDVVLKKTGANYTGCCPFHQETTGSFTVSPAKGMYKCFGCGKGGNSPISFVMDKENMDFPDAIKYLAGKYNITLEYDQEDEETKELKLKRADYIKINRAVARRYQEQLMALRAGDHWTGPTTDPVLTELLYNRKLTTDTIITFQIGYAGNKGNFISQLVTDRGLYNEGIELGVIGTNQKEDGTINNYDTFRNRIIFPIHNDRGEIVGFGGRTMADDKKQAKYLNSKESSVYKKDKVLYGLYQAGKAIRDMGFAVVVEGYYDVISFHQGGMANTVAPCGTALTDGHAKLLRRYTNTIILMGDSDAAGQKANLKAVNILLKYNFKIDVCLLPEKEDPDSFARSVMNEKVELVPTGDDEDEEAPF